jgi:hypothetical protein
LVGLDRGLEIDDESLVFRHRARLRIVGREQLVVCILKALTRIGPRHQIRMRRIAVDLVDLDLPAGIVGIRLIARQSLERLVGRRFVAPVGVQEAQHLVERPVLQHELDDVFDCRKLIGHVRSPLQ